MIVWAGANAEVASSIVPLLNGTSFAKQQTFDTIDGTAALVHEYAGGRSLREPADQFYGDRSGGVQDPAGNQWWISTHVEDVSHEEMKRRMDLLFRETAGTH